MTMNTQEIQKRLEDAGSSSSVVDLKAKIQQNANAVINSPTMELDRMVAAERDEVVALEARYAHMQGRHEAQKEAAQAACKDIIAQCQAEISALDERIAGLNERMERASAMCERRIQEETDKFEKEAKALSTMIAGKRTLIENLQGY